MKRRTALQLIGASSLSAALPLKAACQSLDQKKLGFALVGLGNYATQQLAPALEQTAHCYLVGIVTGTPQKAKEWKAKYNIPDENIYNYKNFDAIAENDTIDIVYIVLPNFMHAEYTIRAFEAGKHVICEKPMGMNVEECKAMLAAQKRSGKLLQIGYRLYYEPVHLGVKSIGEQQKLGKVKMIESSLGFRMARPNIWRMKLKEGGGGAIMDLGVYCIQAARRMVGELPKTVLARGYEGDKNLFKDIYESMYFQMEFPNGSISNTSTSFNAYVDRFYAACEQGWLELKPSFNAGQKPNLELNTAEKIAFDEQQYEFQQVAQMDTFALNIKNNTKVVASGEEGLIDLQIIEAIKASAKEGKVVNVD
ncbi:MAG: Gfo/Idh/MocA family oxidoreductase, partial [Bacteroidota bacterium]